MKKTYFVFSKYIFLNLRRQWYTLPFLFLFPTILLGLTILFVSYFLIPSEVSPIEIGIVDLTESEETELVLGLLKEAPLLGSAIKLEKLEEDEAKKRIKDNQLGSYILFPQDFVAALYEGNETVVKVIANPKRPTESELTKGLVDSMMRHINISQANILLLNERAKELNMNDKERQDYLLEQFMSFAMFVGSKDKLVKERDLTSYNGAHPLAYYTLSLWFVLTLSWLFILYIYLTDSVSEKMKERLTLYGVTEGRQIITRLIISLLIVFPLSSLLLVIYQKFNDIVFFKEDYFNLVGLLVSVSIIFLIILGLIDSLFKSYMRTLIQASIFLILLIFSGALIPIIYFPLSLQKIAEYNPLFETFFWYQEIILNERFYVDFTYLLIVIGVSILLFSCVSLIKERMRT